MILQALKQYYDRKAADPNSDIAPLGWEKKEIPFLVVIDEHGDFLHFSDTRETMGKKLRAKGFVVPSLGEAKGNGIKANLFWENAEYMFGVPMKEKSDLNRVAEQHEAFKQKVSEIMSRRDACEVLMAVHAFLENLDREKIQKDPLWPVVKELNQSLLLCVNGHGVVTDDPEVRKAVDESQAAAREGCKTLCLVSGDQDVMATLEPPIRGVQGASTMGAHLVAVNNKVSEGGNGGATPAFASFMKEQGANSPIGKIASLAYTTALNTLLGKDSRQKLQVGDATTVFWSEKADPFEETFGSLLAEPPADTPDQLTEAVAALYRSAEVGVLTDGANPTRFYVLGLSPNSARISVRFWHVGTINEMAAAFRQYFDDLRIAHGLRDKDDLSLWRLLLATASQGKSENIAPNLAGNVMRCMLGGLPFPATLLQATILRIKAERDVTYPRAKLIKGSLNRKFRSNANNKERMLTMSLDKGNADVGYRLGRLFAVLEKIQQEANPGINATIRDKFYASASSTPSTVFGNLMRLKNHHLSKLENPGRKIWFEKILGEVISAFPAHFPAHLNLVAQGQFAIGYYHQAQDFWTKKTDKENA